MSQSSRYKPPSAFWKRTVLRESGCMEWLGAKDKDGYGVSRFHGKSIRAHRHAYILVEGEIPTGKHVCHRCDNPGCCNPEHLFLGTHDDNMRDKVQKGRCCRGQGVSNSKLTPEKVFAIRSATGTSKSVAAQFGISMSAVDHVRHRRRWQWLEDGGAG